MKKFTLAIFFCLLIPFSLEAKEKVIQLQYKPNQKVKVQPRNVPPVKIYLEEIRDARPQPREIGENQEKDQKILIVTSDSGGARQFVRSALNKEFRDKGFSVEDSSGQAQKIIGGTLMKFWTIETSRYNSQAQLRIEVKDKTGVVYFNRTYSGTGKNFGRSLSEQNYYESLSDALANMVDGLFSDSEFLKALAEKPGPGRAEEKAVSPMADNQPLPAGKAKPKGRVRKPASPQPATPGPPPPPGSIPTGPAFGPK